MGQTQKRPSYRESNKGIRETQGPTLYRCPFYRSVRLIGVSIKRELESTVFGYLIYYSKAYYGRCIPSLTSIVNLLPQDKSGDIFMTSNGRVDLTEEEKETFASEGLPLPNRAPLTKVGVTQATLSINNQYGHWCFGSNSVADKE